MADAPATPQGDEVTFRILVVDDSPAFRRTVGELLGLRGFELVTAGDGDEALTAASDQCPNAVLVDVNLPGDDGFTVARSLATVCPRARIVLTSSDLEAVSTALLNGCGAAAFVPKTDLVTIDLRRLLGG
jgi:CheY-like chemotaxis protein